MKNDMHRSERARTLSSNFYTPAAVLLLGFSSISCTNMGNDDSEYLRQKELLTELELNRTAWTQAGVSEYSLTLEKDCDCPDELKEGQTIAFAEDPEISQADDFVPVVAKTAGISSRKVGARDEGDSRQNQAAQAVRMESLFTDLRQAILQNSVQQVSYNSAYGYPQTVVLNTARQSLARNYDDDNRNPISNLTIQANNFQALRTRDPQNISLNGRLIRESNPQVNVANQYWLVDDNGRWNQLNVPGNINPTLNNITNQSYVQVNGQWLPGGINGQGLFNLNQITPNQNLAIQNNLNGTLFYSVANNSTYDLDDFYVTSDSGRKVFLNVPSNLQNNAYQYAGQRVNLSGNWTTFANDPNGRFIPNGFNAVNTNLERFSGVLSASSNYPIPGVQQSYVLVSDFGSILELQIPPTLLTSISYSVGQRVELLGTRLNAGNFGQQIIYVQSVNPVQNLFTTQQVSGVISAVQGSAGYNNAQTVLLQSDTGSMITVVIPNNFSNPYNPLTAGMRIQLTGAWIANSGFGQGVFEARSPVQIQNLGYTTNNTLTGTISNIGSFANGQNCSAQQSTYGFTADNGQTYQLSITNTTQITGLTGQTLNIPYQARVQVSGITIAPGIFQAQTINVFPQAQATIAGTIIEVGPVGGTFTCTGNLSTYRLLDSNGNAYSITTTANSIIQGSLGSFLRIGDYVQASGTLASNSMTFYATQIIATQGSNTTVPPYQNYPVNQTTFTGTITGLDCPTSGYSAYFFVDQSGTVYRVSAPLNGISVNVGSSVQVTGTLVNNQIQAQQIIQLQTFADPINRIPISGTIMSTVNTLPSSCGMSVYTYQFQSDTGQIQQLRLTRDAAPSLQQPVASGTRITVTGRVRTNNPQIIDAVETQYSASQSFGFIGQPNGLVGQSRTIQGTITATSCPNEYYLVDPTGLGFQLQLSSTQGTYPAYPGLVTNNYPVGTKLNVTGQIIGNMLIASSAYPDTLPVYFPPVPTSGTITSLINTENLSCGGTISTYTFQNDNGRTQRLRVASSAASYTGQYLNVGSRVNISNKLESFDGSVIDALNIITAQQAYY